MKPLNKLIIALTLTVGTAATVMAAPPRDHFDTVTAALQYRHRDRDRDRDNYGWAGTYTGYNSLYDARIRLVINRNGKIKVTINPDRGRTTRQKGSVHDGWIKIDKNRYDVERREGDGDFTIVQQNDRRNRIEFHRAR